MLTQPVDALEARAQELEVRSRAFIDGGFVDAVSGRTFDCISPIDGRLIASIAECDAADVDKAVAAAREAFEDGRWRDLSPKRRKTVLLGLARLMYENAEELALLETIDMGKPITESLKTDISGAAHTVQWYGEAVDKMYDEIAPTPNDVLSLITREPLGVVAAIVPWNFPLLMAVWKVGPALATGNSIIVKPAEQSPLTAIRIAELAAEAGIPDGVINVLPGYGETSGQALARHMDVDKVAFTGSAEVGKLILGYAGESNMKRVSLECGGKTPQIVLADADLEAAVESAAWGIFYNQGEVCTAASRLVVEESIKEDFMDKLVDYSSNIEVGNPLDPATEMGAMVDAVQTERVMGYIELGKGEGATLRKGGDRIREDTGGWYIEPTIFDDVSNDMKIAQEEIFGPVLSTISVADLDEAIDVGNDTMYGLAACVWTNDLNKAHKAGRALRAGSIFINCWDAGDVTVPFGGFKQSGFGRDKSLHALEKYTELKTTWIQLSDQ